MAVHIEFKRIANRFFNEYCTYCTLHGVRYFAVKVRHWSERLFWAAAIALSLCLSFLMIYSSWLDWQEHPSTMIATKEENPVSKMPFPTVIICPETKVVRDKFDISSKFDSNYKLLPNVSHVDQMRLSKLAHICSRLPTPFLTEFADEDTINVIKDVAPNVEQITQSCSWKGTIIDCSKYLEPIMTNVGVCFAFNGLNSRDIYTDVMAPGAMISKGNPNVSQWNMENGYERETGKEEYPIRVTDSNQISTFEINLVVDKRNDNFFCSTITKGFTVILTSPYEPNIFTTSNVAFGVAPSEDTHVHFAPKMITTSNELRKYSPDKRECYFQSERQLRFFKTYSEINCQMECWANFTARFCGCVYFWMPRDNATKICGTSQLLCFSRALRRLNTVRQEKCDCLPSCTSIDYPWKMEQIQLKSADRKQYKESQHRARLRISLDYLQVKTMQRMERVTLIDFLIVCGGILGLFMGFSVLSVVELIYHPFVRLYWTIQRMKEEDEEERNRANQQKKPENDNKRRVHPIKRRSRLRSYLLEYCDNSSIHGLRYFSLPTVRRSGRRYWAISCVVSLSLCAWMTYNVWFRWQSSPALIRLSNEIGTKFTAPIPTITICPEIKTTKQKLDLHSAINNLSNLSDIEAQRLNALSNVCPLLPNSVAFEDKFANESIYDTIQDVAPTLGDTLFKCNWNSLGLVLPCTTETTPIMTDEGLCFAYNALNSHEMYTNEMAAGMKTVTSRWNVSHWSLENGYDAEFYKDEYPTRLPDIGGASYSLATLSVDKRNFEHQCNRFGGGFKLILTPPGEVLKMSRKTFQLHIRKFNHISFETKLTKTSEGLRSYRPDQRQCFYQSERRLRFLRMYTKANCEEECLANFTSLECGCVHFSMPRDNKTKVCGGASFACLNAAKKKFLTDQRGSQFHSDCNCLPACVSIEYKAHIDRFHIEYNTLDMLTLRDKGTEMALLFLRFKNIEIHERIETYTVIDFLAYCGGLLGMFMGISVLSIVEIVYFATLRLFLAVLQWRSENAVAPLIPWH